MPRRAERSPNPIQNRKKALEDQVARLKAQLAQTQTFIQEAPVLKAKVQKREQQEILQTYRRPVKVEGPADFRYELIPNRANAKPKRLRKERSKAPLLTLVLLVTLGFVFAYAVRTLWHG